MLLDGHGSRFELPFLQYINDCGNEGHCWNACIGVPYGTALWQVGDSQEQNGTYKMELTHAKRELLEQKALHRQEYAIKKTDVVLLVRKAFEKSFQ